MEGLTVVLEALGSIHLTSVLATTFWLWPYIQQEQPKETRVYFGSQLEGTVRHGRDVIGSRTVRPTGHIGSAVRKQVSEGWCSEPQSTERCRPQDGPPHQC